MTLWDDFVGDVIPRPRTADRINLLSGMKCSSCWEIEQNAKTSQCDTRPDERLNVHLSPEDARFRRQRVAQMALVWCTRYRSNVSYMRQNIGVQQHSLWPTYAPQFDWKEEG